MKTKTLQLLFVFLFAVAGYYPVTADNCSGNAPVTIAPSMTATVGTLIVPIKVGGTDFVNINTISLKLKFDKDVLTYVSIDAPNKPGTWSQPQFAGTIITGNTAELGISHTGPTDDGWSLTDGQILYNLTFIYNGGSTNLTWNFENEQCQYANVDQLNGTGPGLYLCQSLRNYVGGFICNLPAPSLTCPGAVNQCLDPLTSVVGYVNDIQEIHCATPPSSAGGYWVDNGPWVWQSFHPGKTGVLKSVSLGLWNIDRLPFTLHIALYPGDGVCAQVAPNTTPLWVYDTTFTSPTGPVAGSVSGVFTFNIPEALRPFMIAGQLYNFSFSGIHNYSADNPNDYAHGWYVSSPVCSGMGSPDPMPGGGTYGYLPSGGTQWTTGCVTNYHIAFNTVMGEVQGQEVNWVNYSPDIQELHCPVPPTSASGYWVDNGPWVWQSFYPGKTGVLKSVTLGLWNIVHLPFTLHIALYPGDGICAKMAPETGALWTYDTTFTTPTGPISGAVSGVFTFNVPESERPFMSVGQMYNFSFSGIHSYVEDNPNDYNHGWYVSSPVCGGAGTNDPMPGGGTYGYLPVGPTWTTGCVSNYHIAFNTEMGEIPGLSVGTINSCGIKTLTCNYPSPHTFPVGTTNVTYTVKNMAGATATCSFPVTITPKPGATISYPGSPYCASEGTGHVKLFGKAGGTFSSSPGLVINPVNGNIDLATSLPDTYTVNYTLAAAGGCPEIIASTTVSITPSGKTLNLSVFLEGLYIGGNTMRKAQNGLGDQFPGDTADLITVELHNSDPYNPAVYVADNVKLKPNGEASFSCIPLTGSYYVTIKHRNSVMTTSALPVVISGATTNYAFDAPSKAYMSNLALFIDNVAAIFAGDENQDTIIDASDINDIYNLVILFPSGYIKEDVNGDGIVDGSDLNITNNNNERFVRSWTP